ncbi:MAG TPA: glycosyltransferase [Acidimicrobiales bacterium]|nr:glycosyltransferase [Acidimicrobiales bacterium]
MRVLTLIHLYPPHHVGGYEVACRGAMERFAEQGHEVMVLTSDFRLPDADEVDPSLSVEVRRDLRLWFDADVFEPIRPGLADRIALERGNQQALRAALRDLRPDVASVWSLGYSSWALPRMLEDAGVPLVLTLLDDWPVYAYVFDGWTRMFDKRPWAHPLGAALGLCTRLPSFDGATVSVASRMIAQSIAEHGRWKFPDAALVPLGVDTRELPVRTRPEPPWRWRVVYVGRVVPDKGVPTLIRALAHLPADTQLTVIGHGPQSELDAMAELARQVGADGRVEFTRVARSELAARIGQADVLVFPSEWPEPFGLVPLEAMACGVPVVATGTGGSGEFLDDGGNCVLFAPGDPAALAGAVRRVAGDPPLRRRIVAGGATTAGRLTMDRFTDELEALHRQAAALAGAGR